MKLDIGFKHVYGMAGTQQTHVKCCQSVRHTYLFCRALSAKCIRVQPSATKGKFPYFNQLDIGFKHVYNLVGTQQTCVKCCQLIVHAYLVCRALSAHCNHLWPSATMAKFPYFYQLDIGFKRVYDMVGTQQTRVKCCNRLDMHIWSVEHYWPSATICFSFHPWPSFLISIN